MRPSAREEAVSSVVGTVLMLAVTVTVFAGFSVVALDYVQSQPRPPRAELALVQGDGSLYLVHRGGESFATDGATLHVNKGGADQEIAMTDARLASLGTSWDLGDQVCIQGSATGCLFGPLEDVRGAYVVGSNSLLAETGERGSEECIDATAPVVVAWTQSPSDLSIASLGAVTVRAVVVDAGCAGVDPAAALTLVYGLQASVGTPTTSAGAMASVGANVWEGTIPAQAWSSQGNKYLVYRVEGLRDLNGNTGPSSVRSDRIDNGVADPGFPFVDKNNDAVYLAGVDFQLAASEVADGTYDAGVDGLVIPASVGAITSSGAITFTAGDAANDYLSIGVSLTANGGSLRLSSPGTIQTGAVTLKTFTSGQDIAITNTGGANRCNALQATGTTVQSADIVTVSCAGAVAIDGGTWSAANAGNALSIASTGAGVTLSNAPTMLASGSATLTGSQAVSVAGATFTTTTSGGSVTIGSTAGALTATGLGVTTVGDITLSAATTLGAHGANLQSSKDGATITVTGATSVDLGAATLNVPGAIQAGSTAQAAALDVSDATFTSTRDTTTTQVKVESAAAITANSATTLTSIGGIEVKGASLAVPGLRATATRDGSAISISSTSTTVDATGAQVSGAGAITVSAKTTLTATSMTAATTKATTLLLESQAGALDAKSASLRSASKVTLSSVGDLHVEGADLRASGNDDVKLDTGNKVYTLYLGTTAAGNEVKVSSNGISGLRAAVDPGTSSSNGPTVSWDGSLAIGSWDY